MKLIKDIIDTITTFAPLLLCCCSIYAIIGVTNYLSRVIPERRLEKKLKKLDKRTPVKYFTCDDPRLFHRLKKKGKTSTNVLYLVGEWRVLEKKIYDTDSYSDDNGKMVSIPSSNPYVSETYGFVTDFRVSISVCEECIRFERRNNSSSKDVIARHLAEPMIKVFFPNHEYLEENAVRTRIEHTKY